MQYRRFGKTDYDVSVIGFGGAAISGEGRGYGFGAISEDASIALCHRCIDAGINLFDTAPVYGFGTSEQRLGKALLGRRDDVFLVSKSGITWDDNKRMHVTNEPDVASRMLEQSLRDLRTEYLDLYLVHWPDKDVDIRRPVEALRKAQEQGKIRFIGLSNTNPDDLTKAMEVAEIAVLQSELSLFHRGPVDDLYPMAREHDLGFMTWGTLDKGILTGRVTRERTFDRHDLRSRAPWWTKVDRTPKFEAMAEIEPLLRDAGHSGLELALGYVLALQETSTALCGVRDRGQLESAIAALDNLPSADVIDAARQIAENNGIR